jgi:CubicO group peptidase (beta-lactamase class C family)
MRSGSLAKQFTALGLLKLQNQGALNLKDTAYKYLEIPSLKEITIEQLISHTSGLEDAEYIFEDQWDSTRYAENADVVQWYANNHISHFRQGTQFEYNNGAYYLLAGIIEAVSGMPFRAFMKEEVFEEIGMGRTSFIEMENPKKIEEKALCYEQDSLGNWQAMEGQKVDNLVGAGGIYTNLNDYYTYLTALRNGKIWDKESLGIIFKPISMNIELHSEDMSILKGKESSYAMGWEVTDSLAVSAGMYYGVNNWVIFERERPLTIVIFTNSDILFKEKLVDKTYQIVDAHFDKCCTQNP